MSGIPSVVIADDGQLDRVFEMLEDLGFAPERVRAGSAVDGLVKPRDLIVMSWHPTKEIPTLLPNADGVEPTKVCFHSQDFLPLRQRLSDLGVDYLVHSALDNNSLRAFLQSQLHAGADRRAARRLQLGGTVLLEAGDAKERVKLADLSKAMCRVVTERAFPLDAPVALTLPKGLGGDAALEISGRVVRSSDAGLHPTRKSYSTVVRFEAPSESVAAQLAKILAGEQIGTRTTPLQPEAPTSSDRRADERRNYDRPVALIDLGGAESVLGRDLSMSGVRLTGAPEIPEGTGLTIALYGAVERGEPVVLDATVVRAEADDLALRFTDVNDSQRRDLERLLGASTMVESLRGDAETGRCVAGRVLARPAA